MSTILSTYLVRFRPGIADVETAHIDGYRLEGWSNDLVIFNSDGEPKVIYPREIIQSIDCLPYEEANPALRHLWSSLEDCCQVLRSWMEQDLIRFVSLEKLWKGFEEVEDLFEQGDVPASQEHPVGWGRANGTERGRLYLYTESNRYSITFRPSELRDSGTDEGYLGCIVSKRKSVAGEKQHRGRDLADGEFSHETWSKIVCDMFGFELIEPVKEAGETIIEIDEKGKVISP